MADRVFCLPFCKTNDASHCAVFRHLASFDLLVLISYCPTDLTFLSHHFLLPMCSFLPTSRREGLGALAGKVLSKCDEMSPQAKDLAKEVEELEKKSSSMGPMEMADAAAKLSDNIQVSSQ